MAIFKGLLVTGTCVATVYSTSDARIKDDVQNIPEQDALNLLKMYQQKHILEKICQEKEGQDLLLKIF